MPHLIYEVTGACNLRCRYCYNVWHLPGGPRAPSGDYGRNLRTLKTIFRQARVSHVTFTGGEPLLAQRLPELVLLARLRGKGVTIITNGNAAGRDLYGTLVSLGVGLFEVPLLAADPVRHDSLTGISGSWARARNSIETLLDLGARVAAVIVLTRLNAGALAQTLHHLHGCGVRDVLLARFNPGGRGLAEWRSLLPPLAQLRGAFATADRLVRSLDLRISANVCAPVCVLDPRDYPHIPLSHCSSDPGRRPLTLDAAGDLRFCNHSPVVAGNIHREPLAAILRRGALRQWQELVPRRCQDCSDWRRCLGGCRAAGQQLGCGLHEADPIVDHYLPHTGTRG
jgi:radical SAM protein with 4Fe4S-binding SPASM domain